MRNVYSRMRYLRLCLASLFAAGCLISPVMLLAGDNAGKKRIAIIEQKITGTIRDVNGNPLAGASVSVKGTVQNTVSDANGLFTLTVADATSILVISYVGYATQEITVGNNTSVTVTLQSVQGELQQVVVVGYGTQNKRDVTGAVKSIQALKLLIKVLLILHSNCYRVKCLV